MAKTFFILAGESSGDKHAARLVAQLKAQAPGTRCVGMGGTRMAAVGFEALKNLDGMQVVGFWEVAKRYSYFKQIFDTLLDQFKALKPDALICVDYPGFNLRFAEAAKKLNIPVLYYIVPQVWAWKAGRAKKMARDVQHAFCVFPFEPPFFQKYGLPTTFVGHPLVDTDEREHCATILQSARAIFAPYAADFKTISFLPGSRESEIKAHLQPMRAGFLQAQTRHGKMRALISVPDKSAAGHAHKIEIIPAQNDPLDIQAATEKLNSLSLSHSQLLPGVSDFSVVKSGTSTLEAALAGNPMCALYKGSPISFAIARLLVNIPVFSLANIVLGQYAVPELLQDEVNPARLAQEIERGLFDLEFRTKQRAALAQVSPKLGGPGASKRTAHAILETI